MIWVTLALFAISFIATVLLAPKPEIEDRRPDTFDNSKVPRATEDAPVPLILGRVRFRGPNTIWWGAFRAEERTERVKTGLFTKKTVVKGYDYYLSLQLAICLGNSVQLRKIRMDDKVVYEAASYITSVDLGPMNETIDQPDAFGGVDEGGGWVGDFTWYAGGFSQNPDSYLEDIIGEDLVPGYRGTANIVFKDAYIGESGSLRRMDFEVSAYTRNLDDTQDVRVNTDDIEPAEALMEILRDPWRGLGHPSSRFNFASFEAAQETLVSEGQGVSLIVSASQEAETIIQEILRQIDGVLFEDPSDDGRIHLKLIREDYDVATLPIYDEDDIKAVRSYKKTSWQDLYNEVKVSYQSLDTEDGKVAIAQDIALQNMMGRRRTSPISFPLCYDDALAASLAARELSRLSVPIFQMTIEMNRSGFAHKPGDVIKISWPEYGLVQAVVRIQKIDKGELLNNRIVLEVVQDIFSISTTVYAAPVGSSWVDTRVLPLEITNYEIIETPQTIDRRLPAPSLDGFSNVIVLAGKPQTNSTSYDSLLGNSTGVYPLTETAIYPTTFTLAQSYGYDAGFATGLDATGFDVDNIVGTTPVSVSLTDVRTVEDGLIYLNGEWMGYTGITDNTGGSYTITNVYRGLFGTRPRDHSDNDNGFLVSSAQLGDGSLYDILASNGTFYGKLLDRVGPLIFDEADATEIMYAVTGYRERPYRPRFLRVDSSRSIRVEATNVSLSWVSSNRENDQTTFENDAAQTPDSPETYDIEVWVDGVENVGLAETSVTSPTAIDLSALTDGATVEFRVYSNRTSDGVVSGDYAIIICPLDINLILPAGDMDSGSDFIIPAGDMDSGDDKIKQAGS